MFRWSCRVTKAIGILVALAALASCQSYVDTTHAPALTVFAAASLQPPFDKIARQAKVDARFNYAGTQTLTAQLTQGAQADVFASADSGHMKTVQDAGLLTGPAKIFAHNRLEIAVGKGNPQGIHTLADLSRPGLVVVLADLSVPAGKYAQQALAKAGVAVKPASLELEVTAVLNKVALGEADAGIVYVSDVLTSGKVDGIPIPDSQNVVADYSIAGVSHRRAAEEFIALVLGIPLALVLSRTNGLLRSVLRALTTLPMVLPPVVGGVALLLAFGRRGLAGQWLDRAFGITLPFTTAGAILAEAFVAMPFLIITTEAGLRAMDRRFEDAAATLGAGRWTTFRRVTVPLIAPSLGAGAALCWARALGEFGATITFAGSFPGQTETMPIAVYYALENDPDAAITLSLVLLLVSVAVLVSLRDRWLRGSPL